ncbi:uncharacterized protein LOC110273071 [Arachis duranensis]|uniref:Uncharacterized protein LOC110273071 n=1 Tax=Arachis duranensis TaxID=130453 RepID=A0A6P5M8L2_ARADU|nr:uncharacterized protein LOC110273071 [Arachis duranensis]
MASEEESVLVLVYCSGKIQKSKRYGVKFTDREPVSVFISSSSTLSDLKNNILQKFGISGSKNFPEVRIHELFTKLDVGVDSSGASDPFHNSTGVGGASCLMPMIAPSVPLVASPSFAADLDRTEAVDIIGDSDDDTAANPNTQHGPSSSGTQQYPPHFSTLNLEALGEQADGGPTVGGSSTEFQIGQSFQNKDEAVLSVKDYNIRRGVEYRVIESDHLKYHGKCKEFGKGCTWLIRVALRAHKGTWEVRSWLRKMLNTAEHCHPWHVTNLCSELAEEDAEHRRTKEAPYPLDATQSQQNISG